MNNNYYSNATVLFEQLKQLYVDIQMPIENEPYRLDAKTEEIVAVEKKKQLLAHKQQMLTIIVECTSHLLNDDLELYKIDVEDNTLEDEQKVTAANTAASRLQALTGLTTITNNYKNMNGSVETKIPQK